MKLSVSCPNCGKQFRNIKPEMAGKKARCSCGTIVRLGAGETSDDPNAHSESKAGNPATDLLNVDLLGDEILGDQLLGGDLASADSIQPKRSEPAVSRPALPGKSNPKVPVTEPTSQLPKKTRRTQSKRKKNRGESNPSRESQAEQRPLFGQSYSDLDDILAGAGDASPVIARPRPDASAERVHSPTEQTQSGSTQFRSTQRRSSKRRSTVGFLAALSSATLAFWFGMFVVVSRFQIVDQMLLSDLSQHLQSVFTATLAEELTRGFQILFVSLGWVLWVVAVALVIVGVAQFINAWVKLLVDRQPVRWADGMAATLGVGALFLMVAVVFAQASFADQQHRLLDEYELPVVTANEELENVSRLRAKIDARNKPFTTSMLVGAAVPLAIFIFSAVRLFTKVPDSTPA